MAVLGLPCFNGTHRERLLRIVHDGVWLSDFVDGTAAGEFQVRPYVGADPTPAAFDKHVPPEFASWVDSGVAAVVRRQCVAEWSSVVDVSATSHPTMTLPLDIEPSKPRLFWDGRWLNLMCRRVAFTVDGVRRFVKGAWRGVHQVTRTTSPVFTTFSWIQSRCSTLVSGGESGLRAGCAVL